MRESIFLVAIAMVAASPACYANPVVDAPAHLSADTIGTTVRDVHGRRVGTVRDIEYGRQGDVRNVVIALGVLPSGGDRYVVVPPEHLDTQGGELRFRGARERLVDAPRRADALQSAPCTGHGHC